MDMRNRLFLISLSVVLLASLAAGCIYFAAPSSPGSGRGASHITPKPPPVSNNLTAGQNASAGQPQQPQAPPQDDETPVTEVQGFNASKRPLNPQIGLNFIRFYYVENPVLARAGQLNYETEYFQPDWIFNDFKDLKIQAYRQLVSADLGWANIEPINGYWDFDAADSVLNNSEFEPIVTLFAMQYASATPPWETGSAKFQKTLGADAEEYLETIIDRYGDYVKYWEIGNEMDHWRAATEGVGTARAATDGENGAVLEKMPESVPADGFTPEEQGAFFSEVAEFIRERDPDAVIVMPGMSSLDSYHLDTWLAGVVHGGCGKDCFDIVNYHFYPGWEKYNLGRLKLQNKLQDLGLDDKPVWITETGATSSPTLTVRTNYPNSEETQAADVFRRFIQAYSWGDSLALWHCYIGSNDAPDNDWRLYGIRNDDSTPQLAYYSFKLFASELVPFENVSAVYRNEDGKNVYKIETESGDAKYVAWGSGTYTLPAGVSEMTSVVPDSDGEFSWNYVGGGSVITMSAIPVLIK